MITKGQYQLLSAVQSGAPHTMWPTMRICLQKLGLIRPTSPPIEPSESRRRRVPVRTYEVTGAGSDAMTEYEKASGVPLEAARVGFQKVVFGEPAGE